MIRPATPVERTARRKRWLYTWKKSILSQTKSGGASPLSLLLVSVGTVSQIIAWKDDNLGKSNYAVLFLLLLLLLVCYFYSRWSNNSDNMPQQQTRGRYIPLLLNEAVILRHYLSPGLESRFTCSDPVQDLPCILQHLRQRVQDIVHVNPWLCGYLKTKYGIPSIWYDETRTTIDLSRLFREIRVDDPSDLEQVLTQHTSVEVGAKILNTNQPFVQICMVYSPNSPDYYVTVCCTHMVGEPNLLYQLWGMLSPSAVIVPLYADRCHSYKKHPWTALKGAARGKFLYYFLRSQASIWRTMLLGHEHAKKNENNPKPIIMHRRYVNIEWVQAQKEAYQKRRSINDDPSYISTQDVLTTWFFSQMKPSCICVAYALQDRVEHVTKQHMGNYLDALVLFPDEYSNPSHVRRAVASMGEWAPPNNHPAPNDLSAGLVTGWHSRYVDLQLPRSVRQTHLPLRGAMFTGMIPRVLPCMCLFRTSHDQYAVLTLSRDELEDTSALGSPVMV